VGEGEISKISSAEATKNQWKNFIASKVCSRLPSFDILVFPVKLKNRQIGRCSWGVDNDSKYVEILLSCDKESETVGRVGIVGWKIVFHRFTVRF
jgi:hypothetical protein